MVHSLGVLFGEELERKRAQPIVNNIISEQTFNTSFV
jgi:hypothetical protein